MKLPAGAYVTPEGWIVYGDQAYTAEEWTRRGPRRPYRRLTDEERATYHRDWMRAYRARLREQSPLVVGSLHDLRCTGPTRATGCVCQKILMYNRRAA